MPVSIVAQQPAGKGLLHILGVSFGIAVGVGAMIGSGILRAPTAIAGQVPDAAWIIGLWTLGALHAALGANVVAELATALPKAGGVYVYAHRALGDVGGLIVGWANWISTLAGIAAASVVFANFVGQIWPETKNFEAAIAIGLQVLIYGINLIGLREGRLLQETTSLIKALMLLAFAAAAVAIAGELPASLPHAAPVFGWFAVIGAYQLIRGAYAGWEGPVYFAEENETPGRSMPRALGLGLVVTAVLYIGVNAALLAALGVAGTAHSVLPFSTVLMHFGGPVPAALFAAGAMITVASCANANIMSAPRILFALSRDRILPHALQNVNAGGSPSLAFLMTAAGSVALAATGGFMLVFGLIGTLNSLAGLLVGVSIFVLRAREPDLPRPFRAIGYPVLPALVVAVDAALLVLFLSADRKRRDRRGGPVAPLHPFCLDRAPRAHEGGHMSKLSILAFTAALVSASAAQAHVQLIAVEMSNFAFAPAKLELLAGSDYQLHLVNTSSKGHDFAAPELFAAATVAPDDRAKVVDGKVEVEGGQTVDIRFTPQKKGIYKIRCTHFLHTSFGMTGTAVVE